MYKMTELRSKSRSELLQLISELKGKLLALRFENATGQLTETHLIRNTKQDIARIFTVIKEQEKGIVIKEEIPTPIKSKKQVKKEIKKEKELD
ncbi:MAG: 50S ribosomal protein L29 [Mycoplasmataceae bacterium]|nr:50S ribosomal protein L29 [Mycoplasmataceae bacterium]